MASVSVDEAMRRAIALAARGPRHHQPQPGRRLRAARRRTAQVVGEGFHAYAGGPHAEIVALAQAGERARGGTAVVTLEPCDHTGRTGPCSHALIQAGVARVVIAVPDPNPVAVRRRRHPARRRGPGRVWGTRRRRPRPATSPG